MTLPLFIGAAFVIATFDYDENPCVKTPYVSSLSAGPGADGRDDG